jgi:uncharacterized protein (TIGR00725 family)
VAFFGDAEAKETDVHYYLAVKCAQEIAKLGLTVVNGGGPGVMYAATKGAKDVGGKAEIVVIDKSVNMGENYEGQNEPNIGLADNIIAEFNYPDRLRRLVAEADAFLIFRGGTGTISELGVVWAEAKFNYGKHKPIIFVGEFWQRIMDDMAFALAMDSQERSVYTVCKSVEEVVEIFKKLCKN